MATAAASGMDDASATCGSRQDAKDETAAAVPV
jgi:hypothetical protein